MGFHLCRRRTWRIQDNWRSCRTDGICLFDGHSKTDLWKVWRPYQSEWIYGFECRAMHYLLSLYIPYSSSAYWPSWLCNLWFLCWHYVAGNHFQSCLCHSWWGYGNVCDVCSSRRHWLYSWPITCWFCGRSFGKDWNRYSFSDYLPGNNVCTITCSDEEEEGITHRFFVSQRVQ